MTDEVLLERITCGSRLAFNSLYDRYWDALYQAAIKVLQDEGLAKDVVQDVFLDLWMRKDVLNVSSVPGYLYQAVRFQSFKQLRKVKDLDVYEVRFHDVFRANETEDQLTYKELKESVVRSLEELPEKYRKVYELSREQYLSNKEIAKELNLSQRTVEWYLYLVLKHLRAALTYVKIILIFWIS